MLQPFKPVSISMEQSTYINDVALFAFRFSSFRLVSFRLSSFSLNSKLIALLKSCNVSS